jgi:carboxypeptidase Taq
MINASSYYSGAIIMSSKIQDSYDQLLERSKRLTILGTTAGLAGWDMQTYMPAKGIGLRSEQLSLMSILYHQTLTDPKVAKLLDKIEGSKEYSDMDQEQKRNVHLMRKAYDETSKIPEALVAKMSKQETVTFDAWRKAKAAKDYQTYAPELSKMIALKKEAAEILMDVKGMKNSYDALLDAFEPGVTSEKIDKVFSGMRKALVKIVKKVESSGVRPDDSFLSRTVPIEAQRKISAEMMRFISFVTEGQEAGGRLDEAEHPFTTGYYHDVRITTHYYPNRFSSSIYSVLHEGGHAMYEQGIPQEWMYQPIGTPCSYGIHESQSRYVENMIGRSPEFLSYMLPRLKKMTGKALAGINTDDFVSAVNVFEPSKIRIEADEATYGLHIIVRFEMEKDIMSGKLSVDELPQAWNERYDKYLGMEIENDSEGVMQDVHWSSGSLGYFPSYALGNIYGGMFLDKMEKDLPTWRDDIKAGNYLPVRQWSAENIHAKGCLYDPADLVKNVTGKDLDIAPFIRYLERKCKYVYGV